MLEVHAIPLLTDKYDVWLRYFVLQLQRHTLYRVESLVFRGIVLPVKEGIIKFKMIFKTLKYYQIQLRINMLFPPYYIVNIVKFEGGISYTIRVTNSFIFLKTLRDSLKPFLSIQLTCNIVKFSNTLFII